MKRFGRFGKFGIFIVAALLISAVFVTSAFAFGGNDFDGGWFGGGGDSGSFDGGGDLGDILGLLMWVFWLFGIEGVIVVVVILVVVGVVRKVLRKANNSQAAQRQRSGGVRNSSDQGVHITLPDRTAQIEHLIRTHDPNFSANDLTAFAKNVWFDVESAWVKRDMTGVRPVIHDNLYFTTEKQVQSNINAGILHFHENAVINTAYLTSYAKDAQYEYVTLYLNARRIEWHMSESTGKIIRGDKTTRWDMRYKMKFMRTIGVSTKEASGEMMGHNCPNCSAPLDISSSGQCSYCNSTVTTGQYSWVLSDYGTIRNDTVDEGIRN
jgi:predicted lipid-binding transport protein (Tim44 family)